MVVRAMFGSVPGQFPDGVCPERSAAFNSPVLTGKPFRVRRPVSGPDGLLRAEGKDGQALGTLQSALVSGMIPDLSWAGLLAHFMGYRPLFFWTGFFCLAAAIIVIRFVKEDFVRQEKKERSSLRQNLALSFILRNCEGCFFC